MDADYYKRYEPIFGEWRITRLLGEGGFGVARTAELRSAGWL